MSRAGTPCRVSPPLQRVGRVARALIWTSVLATTAQAQPLPAAAPVDGAAHVASTTAELGRLFFTPERRRELDRQREFKTEDKPAPASEPTLTIDGVVTRSSGKRTVWINGTAHNDGQRLDGAAIGTDRRNPGQVVVRPSDAPAIRAKVGDTVDRASGQTGGVLGSGATAAPASAPR